MALTATEHVKYVLQVTEEVFHVLRNYPYEFQCRGKVKVKGKGDMTTYFLTDRKQPGTIRVEELSHLRNITNISSGEYRTPDLPQWAKRKTMKCRLSVRKSLSGCSPTWKV